MIAPKKQSLIREIIFLSIVGFFLVIIAGAFHYNDQTFLLRSRTVYKINTPAGTMSKNKIGSTSAVLAVSLGSVAFCLLLTEIIGATISVFIPSQIARIYSNKDPPTRS